jgi:hypothetical protein
MNPILLKKSENLINICVPNILSNFVNLNDFIYHCGDNLKEFCLDDKLVLTSSINAKLRNSIGMHMIHYEEMINDDEKFIHSRIKSSKYNYNNLIRESISPCQKLLLIAAFIGSDLHQRFDSVILKNAKRTTTRKIRHKSRIGKLKRKFEFGFTLNRLIAIYSSLYDLNKRYNINILNNSLSIELICDINTLINLNLLRYINSSSTFSSNINFNRKIIINFNVEFAMETAEDCGLKLSDFINLNNY